MISTPEVIAALNECLKYEHTLVACQNGYRRYFKRWGLHALSKDMKCFRKESEKRRNDLMRRIFVLEGMPTADHYEFELTELDKPIDINGQIDYFLTMLGEARDTYEAAREAAKEVKDSVSHKLAGRNKEGIEYQLAKFESKQKRVALVGPELYLAQHMHSEISKKDLKRKK